jgi:hypothetical protein
MGPVILRPNTLVINPELAGVIVGDIERAQIEVYVFPTPGLN